MHLSPFLRSLLESPAYQRPVSRVAVRVWLREARRTSKRRPSRCPIALARAALAFHRRQAP